MKLPAFLKGVLSQKDLQIIAGATAKAEKHTSGEIRVRIVPRVAPKFVNQPRHQAIKDFLSASLHKTRDKTGVLIWWSIGNRKFEIVADKGINAKISQKEWDNLAGKMSRSFKRGNFRSGLMQAVRLVGDRLSKHFPRKADDTNEVTNEVSVGGGR